MKGTAPVVELESTVNAFPPIVVDLDGTLTPVDTLHEVLTSVVFGRPHRIVPILFSLMRGKAYFKQFVSSYEVEREYCFPFNERLVSWLRTKKNEGHEIWLATGADVKLATIVSVQLELFDRVIASDGITNCTSGRKCEAILKFLDGRDFWYVGDSTADYAVWEKAERIFVAGRSHKVSRHARTFGKVVAEFHMDSVSWRTWLKAIRVHQWVKNLLVFVPLLASHRWAETEILIGTVWMFFAFCFAASGIYLVNDCVDVGSDRLHPEKQKRPIAAGELSVVTGLAVGIALFVLSLACAAMSSVVGVLFVILYLGMNAGYSFGLKKRMIVDVFLLAGFYIVRILAGGFSTGILISPWLTAFSGFFFLSLALVKRFTELKRLSTAGETKSRGYRNEDQVFVGVCGVVCGFASVLVLSLYFTSETVMQLYQSPSLLWLSLPAMLYWLMRIWLIAFRGELTYDPVVFAIKDRVSYIVFAVIFATMQLALRLDVAGFLGV